MYVGTLDLYTTIHRDLDPRAPGGAEGAYCWGKSSLCWTHQELVLIILNQHVPEADPLDTTCSIITFLRHHLLPHSLLIIYLFSIFSTDDICSQ